MAARRVTDADFDRFSWHDSHVYGFRFEIGDPDRNDWRAQLTLDLDFIDEWSFGDDGAARFKIAPARLTFHNVTDLKLAVDWGNSGFQTALHEISIDRISRTQIENQKICLDRPYYHWRIELNWPAGGEIDFGASGFTQDLLGAPVLVSQQKLSHGQREDILKPA